MTVQYIWESSAVRSFTVKNDHKELHLWESPTGDPSPCMRTRHVRRSRPVDFECGTTFRKLKDFPLGRAAWTELLSSIMD